MKEFMMIFRSASNANAETSPEQLQANIKLWQDWIAGIAAQGKFVGTNRLGLEGKTVKPNKVVTSGPYAEVKEIIGGYLIIKTDSIDEALKFAEGCPVLEMGGNVEVRDVIAMN
jgi:hypothetical protein